MAANVTQVGDSLTVRIGNYQKGVVLPTFLAEMKAAHAGYEEKRLAIEFKKKEMIGETAG